MSAEGAWAGPRALLDLWHPSGAPGRRLVLGDLSDAQGAGGVGQPCDAAIVAPGRHEAGVRWLQDAVGLAAATLAADGLLWVVVTPRRRALAARIVRRAGLAPLGAVLTLPVSPATVHAASIAPATVRDLASRHLGWPVVAASCAGAATRTPAGRAMMRCGAPGCALLAARHADVEPLAWLADIDDSARCTATAAIGPRSDARVALVLRFARGAERPDLAVKTALDADGCARVELERAALVTLGGAARAAGAAVPAVRDVAMPGVIAATVIAGRRAGIVLARGPGDIRATAVAVAAWLRRWNAATASARCASREWLDRLLLAPAARLFTAGAATGEYVAALELLARRLEGEQVIVVAAHNDLTMANVLVDGDRIGVVDWEAATADAPALGDLWYALADIVARGRRQTHAEVVAALAGDSGSLAAAPARLVADAALALALGTDQQLLGFHACWLHHAANELDRGTRSGPFAAVVRAVATTRLRSPAHPDAPPR